MFTIFWMQENSSSYPEYRGLPSHHHLTNHFEGAVAAIDVVSEEQVIAHANVPLHVHVVDKLAYDSKG